MENQFALTLPVSYCTLESRHEFCPRQDFYSLIRLYTVYMVGLMNSWLLNLNLNRALTIYHKSFS